MNNSIVLKLTPEELIALFRKEAKISNDGSVEFSRRGVERLISISRRSLLRLAAQIEDGAESLPECLQSYAGQSIKGGAIFEDLAYDLICYYSESEDVRHIQVRNRCIKLLRLLGKVGLRQSVHIAQNWESNQSPADRVAYRYLLPVARTWDKQFPDEFYSHLERLTGVQLEGASRPYYWANLTNEFVYDHLPKEVADGVRRAKLENASSDKLHQFLSADGLELLQNHLNALLILMSAAASIEDVRAMAARRFFGQYQLSLNLKQ